MKNKLKLIKMSSVDVEEMMFTTFTMPAIFFVTTGSYGITTSTAE